MGYENMSNTMRTPIIVQYKASKLIIDNATLYTLSIINPKTCLRKLSNKILKMKNQGNRRKRMLHFTEDGLLFWPKSFNLFQVMKHNDQ
jgi:hypothetical protein